MLGRLWRADWEWASRAAAARISMKRNCRSERRVSSARSVSACAAHLCRPGRWEAKWRPVPSGMTAPTASRARTNGTIRSIWSHWPALALESSSWRITRSRRRSSSATLIRLSSILLKLPSNQRPVARPSPNWPTRASGPRSTTTLRRLRRIPWGRSTKHGRPASRPTTKCRSWAPKSLCPSSRRNSRRQSTGRERRLHPTWRSPCPPPKWTPAPCGSSCSVWTTRTSRRTAPDRYYSSLRLRPLRSHSFP